MKERMLTVLVPIKDSDATVVTTLPAITPENINVIYKHEGVYKRLWLNPSTNQYEYHEVIDREFPYLGKPLEIFDFTYDATRMGSAPIITAQGVMWYADKDENNNDVTLEGKWEQVCHVSFNGENFYLKQIPTCTKDNTDARYKYDMDFVSERVILEHIYLYDVVQPFAQDGYISWSSRFSFFGNVQELVNRINSSLVFSGLLNLVKNNRTYGVAGGSYALTVIPYVSYSEWKDIPTGTRPSGISSDDEFGVFREVVYGQCQGDYGLYLQKIYGDINEDVFAKAYGYKVVLGIDKKGETVTSDDYLFTFEDNTINEALGKIKEVLNLNYYINRADVNGNPSVLITIGDCEHDFADRDENGYIVRDGDGMPVTTKPYSYGIEDALLSVEKTNTTDEIISRITGFGSEENIPWYYPNPTPDGWLYPVFCRDGNPSDANTVIGIRGENDPNYEKFLKNVLGSVFEYGHLVNTINQRMFIENGIKWEQVSYTTSSRDSVVIKYQIKTTGVANPYMSLSYDVPSSVLSPFSNGKYGIKITLTRIKDNGQEEAIEEFNSQIHGDGGNVLFRRMCSKADGTIPYPLTTNTDYILTFCIARTNDSLKPKWHDYNGYLYDTYTSGSIHIHQNFYKEQNLFAVPTAGYYCIDIGGDIPGTPLPRVIGRLYRDATDGRIYVCKKNDMSANPWENAFALKGELTPSEWVDHYFTMRLCIHNSDGWYLKDKHVDIADYGLRFMLGGDDLKLGDTITFKRDKYITPQKKLVPQLFFKTAGARRYYPAINYPIVAGETYDAALGEVREDGMIRNPNYIQEGDSHYVFENIDNKILAREKVVSFDDIKPSITGMTYDGRRIDVVEEFAYDEFDSDEIWVESKDGEITGEYKHPHFFAKLRPLGFNIFDLALQDDMVISMTTGHCGACNFKIKVDEKTKKNPVQIWEHDVYEFAGGVMSDNPVHVQGSLRRYEDTSRLYYKISTEDPTTGTTTVSYEPVDKSISSYTIAQMGWGGASFISKIKRGTTTSRPIYSAEAVLNDSVGSIKDNKITHFEGDVRTSGPFIASQQDTTDNYVWVALEKDVDTYGTIMPAASPAYSDEVYGTYDTYIRPTSIADLSGMSEAEKEEKADHFVLVNIKMPQKYLRDAEERLTKRLIKDMYDNNYQKFNFTVKFSRIFLAQNIDVEHLLNENSVLYVNFNGKYYRQYVSHYTYKVNRNETLPEIEVQMDEEASVVRSYSAKVVDSINPATMSVSLISNLSKMIEQKTRKYVMRNEDFVLGGNVVSQAGRTSFSSVSSQQMSDTTSMQNILNDINNINIEETKTYANIITGFDQIDWAVGCRGTTLPPPRQDPTSDIPEACSEETGKLWFRRNL